MALRRVTNTEAVEPDDLQDELLKLGIRASFRLLTAFHAVILMIWKEREVPQP